MKKMNSKEQSRITEKIITLEEENTHLKNKLQLLDVGTEETMFTLPVKDKSEPYSIAGLQGMYLQVDENNQIINEMENKNILPVTEQEIERDLERYMVYTLDDGVVGAGKINNYGDLAEIAKIATFPRYQGGQKAKKICNALINNAKSKEYKGVFGLSINPLMMKLFIGLGFVEIEREKLPDEWKKNYDFSRNSKAFILEFEGNNE